MLCGKSLRANSLELCVSRDQCQKQRGGTTANLGALLEAKKNVPEETRGAVLAKTERVNKILSLKIIKSNDLVSQPNLPKWCEEV